MPAKVYLPSPPHGDFRAMPARGGGLALLKWITSFPGNPARGLPTVTGVICLSDATTGEPLMLLDARSVTALRTGAVAAVAARALARRGRAHGRDHRLRPARGVERPLPGRGRLRTGRLLRPQRGRGGGGWRSELGWSVGSRERGAGLRHRLLRDAGGGDRGRRRRPAARASPQHARRRRARARPRRAVDAVAACALFCDEWAQASHGGELTGAIDAGLVAREQVTELGAVLAGDAPGPARRRRGDAV